MAVTKELIQKIIKKIEGGSRLNAELARNKISSPVWYRALRALNISARVTIERRPMVYTREKAEIVRARVKKGEFIKNICVDLGMEYMNFCRFCRRNGIKIMTKALLKENYKRRDYSNTGPRGRKIREAKEARAAARKKNAKKKLISKKTVKKAIKKSAKKK